MCEGEESTIIYSKGLHIIPKGNPVHKDANPKDVVISLDLELDRDMDRIPHSLCQNSSTTLLLNIQCRQKESRSSEWILCCLLEYHTVF